MTTLSSFVDLPENEKQARGLVFTPSEIAQQPDTWRTTLRIFKEHQAALCSFLEARGIRESFERRPAVVLVGAGTSDYIGHALLSLLRQRWRCDVSACASTDLLPNLEDFVNRERNYLFISFSRSGDSAEGVAVIEQAMRLHPKIAHLVITCNAAARMVELCKGNPQAHVVVLDDAVNDRSLVMTSSFTNMVVMGQCLAHAWSIDEYSQILERLVQSGKEMLVSAAEHAEGETARGFSRFYFTGDGALVSIARESALKVLEMTAGRVKTMSETVLGLRHGPMAALDSGTLFICFVSQKRERALYARDMLQEIADKKIVGRCVAVGPASHQAEFAGCCDSYLTVNGDLEDVYLPVVDVIFGQLLGLYCCIAHHLKPDAPSPGGVINRVVQKVRIY